MDYKCTIDMNKADMKRILKYLNWKLEHNDDEIDYVQIAKFLNVDNRKAEEIIYKLHANGYLIKGYAVKCPECGKYTDFFEEQDICNCSNMECDYVWDKKYIPPKTELIYKINRNKLSEQYNNITVFKVQEETTYMASDKKVKVFLSYSHQDEKYKEKLDNHLAVLKKTGKIETWNDRKLIPGKHLSEEIDKKLVEANLIILLLSSDFFASDYCYTKEMKKALELYEEGLNIVVPVIIRPCDWLESPLKNILALPTDGKAISQWDNEDEAYLNVVTGIKKAFAEL